MVKYSSLDELHRKNQARRRVLFIVLALSLVTVIAAIGGILLGMWMYPLVSDPKEKNIEDQRNIGGSRSGKKLSFGQNVELTAPGLREDMNRACDDFYEFACGGFAVNSTFLDEAPTVCQSDALNQRIYEQLESALSEPIDSADPKYVQNLKTAYQFCVHRPESSHQGTERTVRDCLDRVKSELSVAANFFYANRIFKKIDVTPLRKFLSDVIRLTMDTLKEARWLEEKAVKIFVETEANGIRLFAGFDGELFNETIIDMPDTVLVQNSSASIEYNEQLRRRILKSSALENDQLRLTIVESAMKVRISLHKDHRFYLNVPMGVLQGMFYNVSHPQSMNYGSVGSEIARYVFKILTETAQRIARIADPAQVAARINSTSSCWKKQLRSYVSEAMKKLYPDSKSPVSPPKYDMNVAGYKFAYTAYKKWAKDNGADGEKLPGVPYTSAQLFWINAARARCMAVHKDYKKAVYSYVYLPEKFKIIGSFSNLEEFSKDFKCHKGSNMNRESKCLIL